MSAPRPTSPFDELLESNRRELDALYRGAVGAERGAPAPGSAPADAPPPSPAERLLNERYGDGWRFEVTSRRREANEAVVAGTLTLPHPGGARAWFGSAPIAAGADAGAAGEGSAAGVGFSFGGGGTAAAGAGTADAIAAEEAAFERAREDALAHCVALLEA